MSTQTLQSLELAIAQKALDEYSATVANGDAEARDTAACQRRLGQAIDSFQWIVRAEETIRQAVYQGLIEFSAELDEAIEALYRGWLVSSEATERVLAEIQECPQDAAEFRAITSQARERINAMAWARKSRKFRSGEAVEAS